MKKIETPERATERVQIVATPSWVGRIDEWRGRQRPIPTRSEAIRLLADQALRMREPA